MSAWQVLGLVFEHLGNVVSVVLILALLSGKKEARATLGWVLLVLSVPYVGALAYLILGRRPSPFPGRPSTFRAAGRHSAPPDLPVFMARASQLTGLEPALCRDLEFLPGAEYKYPRLFADIESARRRVVLSYYVFRRDDTGRRLLTLLSRKAAEGVEVCLLYDGWGAFWLAFGGFLGPSLRAGVRARPFHPVADPLQMSRVNFRNHRKIAVVDGRIGYTGSINIGDEYLGLHPRFGSWKDVHVRLEGAAALALEEVFREDWRTATGEILEPSSEPADAGDTWLHVIPSGPSQAEEKLFPLLFAQLAAAREQVDILTPYLVPDHSLIAALSVAARQGARVRVLVPGRSNHPLVAAAGRSYYEELLDERVELYEVEQGMLHAKALLIDGVWAMIGSANLDDRSFHLNFEINVAGAHPSLCRHLGATFEEWLRGSRRIVSADVAAKSMLRRLVEGACRTLSPVL
ncbi:MAG: cardiolipin synthase [Deltaproteobacteria bacterium]|nr:cardiolipin synthase [Deltaproteobacteria bacterium]